MKKSFVDPYFESDTGLLNRMGIFDSVEKSEGILRFNYSASTPPTAAVTSEADMKRIFPDTISMSGTPSSLTVIDSTILSSLKDDGAVPTKGYTIYEYTGTLYVPEAASYIFTIETTASAQAELYLDYNKEIGVYGAARTGSSSAKPLEMGEYFIKVRFVQVGVAGSTQTLDVKWRKSTETAANDKTLKCDMLSYDPNMLGRTTAQSATFNENAIVDNLANYENRFKSYFGVQSSAFTTAVQSSANLGKIQVASATSATFPSLYQPFVCSGTPTVIPTGDWVDSTGKINGDVNYYHYLNELKTISNGNYIEILITQLRDMRKLYNALDDIVYEKIKNNPGDTVAVDDYTIDLTTKKPVTVLANTVLTANIMSALDKVSPVERFVLRRLVLLVDLVTHAHISMFLFEKTYSTTVPCQVAIQGILSHFVTRLKNLNAKYDQMFEASSAVSQNDILDNLYENIHRFDKNSKQMDSLSTEFKVSKLKLKSNLKTMESEKSLYSSGNNWTRAFLVVTVIIIATLIAYTILATTNPEYKWIGAGAVSAVAFLTVLIIYFIKSKKMEAFTTYNPVAWSQAIAQNSAIDVIRVAYQYDMMREVNAYVQNTIHMALILQNSKTYSYINHTIEKEINYYNASKQQVDNAKTLAKASERMYNLETRNNMSRTNVYIALIVILTFAIVGYRLSGDRKFFQYTVLGISGFLLLMVALLYIIDVERKVRTDGRKIYWGQPNDMLAKL